MLLCYTWTTLIICVYFYLSIPFLSLSHPFSMYLTPFFSSEKKWWNRKTVRNMDSKEGDWEAKKVQNSKKGLSWEKKERINVNFSQFIINSSFFIITSIIIIIYMNNNTHLRLFIFNHNLFSSLFLTICLSVDLSVDPFFSLSLLYVLSISLSFFPNMTSVVKAHMNDTQHLWLFIYPFFLFVSPFFYVSQPFFSQRKKWWNRQKRKDEIDWKRGEIVNQERWVNTNELSVVQMLS